MKSEVFTNRFEVEKMAEDIFVCDDKPFIYIDYADLRTLRRISTLKYGISIKAVVEALKESIKYKVERFTGMLVDVIDVNVMGVKL